VERTQTGARERPGEKAPMRTIAGAAVALAAGCLEFTPHALPPGSERDTHARSLERLAAAAGRSGAVVAVVGDVQLRSDHARDAVDAIDARGDVDLVVQLGDFTDLGTIGEYRRMKGVFDRLDAPYLVAVGNHDLLGHGEHIYEAMFGAPDLAFTFARTRFVLLDTNSRERDFDGSVPDVAFLAEALAPSPDHDRALVLSHVAPTSTDFDARLAGAYLALVRAAAPAVSFHGHEHRLELLELAGVPLYLADDVAGRTYLLVRLPEEGGIEVEVVPF
jgi:3',5'-cyclic AMP phosphodiesterase CpdA